MWKKIGVLFLSLVATFSVIYALNKDLFASPVVPTYYKVGETFERNNKNTFIMGGLEWKLFYADEATGVGYVVSLNNLVSKFSCSNAINGSYIKSEHLGACMAKAQNEYSLELNSSDEVGKQILASNNTNTLHLPSITDYDEFTKNETPEYSDRRGAFYQAIGGDAWLDYFYMPGRQVLYWIDSPGSHTLITPYKFLIWAGNIGNSAVFPVFKVKLPQKGILKKMNYTASHTNTLIYNETNAKDGAALGLLSVTDGQGPFTFTLESGITSDDVNHQGAAVTDGLALDTTNFELVDLDSTNGTAKLQVKSGVTLDAGTYNVKVKVVDATSNDHLYYPNDPAKTKSFVLTFNVEKATPTIAFKDTSQLDIKIGSPTYTGEFNITNYTGPSPTISLTGGISNVLTVSQNTGDITKFEVNVVSSYSGVDLPTTFALNATIPASANYKEATTSSKKNICVYKGLSSLDWNASKGSYTTTDVTAGATIGTLLGVGGVGPFTYSVSKQGDSGYNAGKGADNADFDVTSDPTAAGTRVNVKTKSSLAWKTYNIQFKVTDTKGDEQYADATIIVSSKSQASLEFKDSSGGAVITNKTIKFDDVNPTVLAEGGSTNNPVEYDFAPTSMQPGNVNASSYASIGKSSGILTTIRTGSIKVQAKRPGDGTYDDIITYLDLRIDPALQTIDFNDTTSIIDMKIGATKKIDVTGKIKSSGATGKGSITYTSSDPSIASVDKTTGNVTAIKAGSVTITAELNNSAEANHDPNYDTVSTTKTVNIYKGMTLSWTDASPLVKADANAIGDKAGIIGVTDNASVPTYKISNNPTSTSQNKDASYFNVVGSGTTADVTLAKSISASDQANHGGTFNVQVDVTDKHGTETIDLAVFVDEADNVISFTDSGANITSLTKKFGENQNTFQLTSISSNGGNATYSVDANDTSGTLNVTGTGAVTINKKGTGVVKVVVASGNGYASGTATMNVTVDPGDQSIAFKDTTTLSRPFVVNTTFMELANLKETSLNTASSRTITYISNTPAICSIAPNGEVTMLMIGTCDIDAKNTDSDWNSVTTNKRIVLYDKMGVTYTAAATNIKAEANAIADQVGTIDVNGNQGAPIYQISTASTSQNADASFFQVIGNGPTADLKLAKKISATDWVSHSGTFKVQVDVKDNNGTETIDIIVNVDEADNDFYFTDSGSKITSLTKQYGENGNSFNLTSTSSNGGSVTYSVDTADTSGTLSVTGTSVIINKTGTGVVKAVVASGSGYAGKTITMNVNVTKGTQAIAFKDTTTVNQAFTANGTFSNPAELKETSLNTSSGRLITYTSNDTSVCTIDAVGTVTMLTTGTCDIDAKNSGSDWLSVTTNKKINLYDGMGVSFTENGVPQAETVTASSGAKVGNLTVNGGLDPKTFAVSTASDAKNKDASYFQVNSSGIVSFKKAIQATDLIGKYNTTKKVYEMFVQFETTDSGNTKVTTDAIVELKGAPLKAEFNTNGTGKVTEEFGPGKTFTLDLSSNKGKGIPTYQLKNDPSMPNDVLDSVDASGLVTIQHANDPSFVGNPLMVEAVIPASNGYDEETIEVEVEITKAPQPDFAFKTPNIKLGHGASITPFFNGNISNGTITMTSGNNALATISGSDIKAKTTDGSVVVTAINSGNRDYKSATATANVTISSAPAYDFVISVPAATYGDTGLKADIVLNGASGANQAQTWSSSDPTIADIDADKNITIKKAGTVTITCVQTSTGEPSVSATAVMVIDPKPIIVTVNDASKYVGEAVPTFSAVIPTADLVGSDTLGQPTFSCKDGTALVKSDTKAGTYDINGTYPTASYPNYAITVKKGKLTVKQDASLPEWFHLEGATSKTTLDGTKWVNEDVNVVLDSAIESAGTYDEISLDNTLWGTTHTIIKEGITTSDVYFRIDATKIVATSQSTSVKIDKTKPVVKSITGTPASRNELEELLNSLTFGKYFKPKYEVSILAEDVLPKDVKENSKLKSIQYNVYQLKDDSTLSDAIASGEMKSGDTLKLVDEGKYMVCAIAQDNAGNQSAELCSGIRIKSMGESSDGKELPDINIDIDGDGIADINITRPGEKKPYLNIDTDGDGKPDINISRDGEKVIPGATKPFLNIISPEVKWNPSKEVDFDKDGIPDFRTDGSLEPILSLDSNDDNIPDLNIDLDNDYIPDINIDASGDKIPETNIDSDGDGKPDINVDKTGTGKPQEGICTNVVWDPITMVKKDGEIIYGSTSGLKPDSKDSLTDNGIIIKPSNPGSIFLPNYALKVEDVTKNVESSTKNQIIEITGANSEVKKVFDVSLSDGEKVIQPDGSILVRIPIDETIKNPRVLLRNEAGIFEEVKVSVEDGYYVFETEYLGTVSIVGDKEEVVSPSDPQEPVPTPDPSPTKPSTTNPSPTVKGTYTPGTGGALTGDFHDMMLSVFLCFASSIALYVAFTEIRKRNR